VKRISKLIAGSGTSSASRPQETDKEGGEKVQELE